MAQEASALLWLALVIAAIPAALWLLKRTPLATAAVPGTTRLVSALPLSASQRLVTVEVGSGEQRLWLVLGVGPQGIAHLHTLSPQRDAGPPPTPAATLAPLLQRLRGRRAEDDAS